MNTTSIKTSFLYWLHLMAVAATYLLPFMVNWKLAVCVYAAVMIQFAIFGKCLMNEHHGTSEEGDRIFYTEFLEDMGLKPNPKTVKLVVRRVLYPTLAVVTLIWQVGLGNVAVLF